jgi:hypothetical protein
MMSFDDFLKTGQIGQLATGLSRDAVRDLLGNPSDTSVGRRPEIWKYGPIELAFYVGPEGSEPFLTSITYHFGRPSSPIPDPLNCAGWLPTGETSLEDFRTHLAEVGIPVLGGVESGPHPHLVLGSAVRVTFDEGKLFSVGSTAKREPEFKQLSLSVRKDDLDQIHREAKSRGISASALCSLWIKEHALNLRGQEV